MPAVLKRQTNERNGPSIKLVRTCLAETPQWVAPAWRGRFHSLQIGLSCYALTTLLVVLGVCMGHRLLTYRSTILPKPADLTGCFANWDGNWFAMIVREGYSFQAHVQSSTAFFPAYPCLAQLYRKATGARVETALLIVSHISFACGLVLLAAYVQRRGGHAPEHLTSFVVLSAAVFPTTFFFRMAYSESLFCFLAILSFYLMERRSPLWLVALVIGLATAARIPGICLLLPFTVHLWRVSAGKRDFAKKLAVLAPLGCWGIAAFILYCIFKFGEPMAFAKAQAVWHLRLPSSVGQKIHSLAVLEPVRAVFDASSPCYWKRLSFDRNPVFSLSAANPLYFGLGCLLVAVGAWKRWLSSPEWIFSAALLGMSYVGRGYEMGMNSSGRFVAVVFPIYLVLGHLLCRCSPPVAAGLLAGSTVLLTIYSALFAAGYYFI
jgi:hypothetical protein